MNYLDSLRQQTNDAYTENGALAHLSTLDANLDFFSRAGAMRSSVLDAVSLFQKAYAENPELALKNLFYMRDIRGGQGERNLFRKCLEHVNVRDMVKLVQHIPEYGRWDDMFELPIHMISGILKRQLESDEQNMRAGEPISLLAKWMPSENAGTKSEKLATELATAFGWSMEDYRKRLVRLRSYLKILERLMSSNSWDLIKYENVPSQAMKKYVGAFKRHDLERYEQYLAMVNSGEKKINTSTLYTYEVYDMVSKRQEETANALWNNLPDYTNGNNALVIADVSGSMMGRPMSVSVSLALYFAERNKGPFNGYFMTFSSNPRLQKVQGKTLSEKMRNLERGEWETNTDIDKAFQAILNAAITENASQEEMPAVLYIISDMQFDQCVKVNKTNFQIAKEIFEEAGYKLPHVVFWNVNARDNSPATKFDSNVTLISGSSQSTFRYAVEGKTPLESMYEVLNSERYAQIKL